MIAQSRQRLSVRGGKTARLQGRECRSHTVQPRAPALPVKNGAVVLFLVEKGTIELPLEIYCTPVVLIAVSLVDGEHESRTSVDHLLHPKQRVREERDETVPGCYSGEAA